MCFVQLMDSGQFGGNIHYAALLVALACKFGCGNAPVQHLSMEEDFAKDLTQKSLRVK